MRLYKHISFNGRLEHYSNKGDLELYLRDWYGIAKHYELEDYHQDVKDGYLQTAGADPTTPTRTTHFRLTELGIKYIIFKLL